MLLCILSRFSTTENYLVLTASHFNCPNDYQIQLWAVSYFAMETNDPTYKTTGIELTSPLLGGRVIFATDEWFAIAENLISHQPPTFDPNAYCSQGKVMDGWESRRRVSQGVTARQHGTSG